jgi:solute carrier family 25 (mitochondrial uncoupling protein), member 27
VGCGARRGRGWTVAKRRWRVFAGMVTGGFGQLVAAPTDVVKTRLQADGRLKLVGKAPRYKGTLDAFRRIPREEGIAGLYRGMGSSLARAALINGFGIASYDHSKQLTLRVLGKTEGMEARVFGSLVSGFVSAIISSPFDVVKSRLINQPQDQPRLYNNLFDCALKIIRKEGVLSLYKGFVPAYLRLGPWQLVFFPLFEELNRLAFGTML